MDRIYIEPHKALQRLRDYEAEVKKCFDNVLGYNHPDKLRILDKCPKDAPSRIIIDRLNSLCGAWCFFLMISKYELLQDTPTDLLSIFKYDIERLNLTPSDCYDSLRNLLPSYAEYTLRSIFMGAKVAYVDRLLGALQNHDKKEFSAFVDTTSPEWERLLEVCRKFWLADNITNILNKSCYGYREQSLVLDKRSPYNRGTIMLLTLLRVLEKNPSDDFRLKLIQRHLHPAYKYLVYSLVVLKRVRTGFAPDALLVLLKSRELIDWYEADYIMISQNPDIIFEEQPFIDFKDEQEETIPEQETDPKELLSEENDAEDSQRESEERPLAELHEEQEAAQEVIFLEKSKPEENQQSPDTEYCKYIVREKFPTKDNYTIEDYELALKIAARGKTSKFINTLLDGEKAGYIDFCGDSRDAIIDYFRMHFPGVIKPYTNRNFSDRWTDCLMKRNGIERKKRKR